MSLVNSSNNYGSAILSAFEYLLDQYPETFVIGQGLWSPWYVGNTMSNLDKKFGSDRIIDSPVAESGTTGAAVGAALAGMKFIVVHPRMDFMLYGVDAIVNQAAKWSHMTGGQAHPNVTIRGIINRGGEQGRQHSQALHSWFAHIPGLRVVMPATVADARDLFISAVLCEDPVVYIDDRWLYDLEDNLPPIIEYDLAMQKPKCLQKGDDVTIVGSGYSTKLALEAAPQLEQQSISAEIIDLRVLNPFHPDQIIKSVSKTGRLLVVDGGWGPCGMASEVITSVTEQLHPGELCAAPTRITLPFAPAPTPKTLEEHYYPSSENVVRATISL